MDPTVQTDVVQQSTAFVELCPKARGLPSLLKDHVTSFVTKLLVTKHVMDYFHIDLLT